MTRFRTLLKPGTAFSPKEEQDRASKALADAVAKSHLRWWKDFHAAPNQGSCLVLGIAPYSQYDLTLLDLIDESLDSDRATSVRVYVANLLDYDTVAQLAEDFPGVGQTLQTPTATLWESGKQTRSAAGNNAVLIESHRRGEPSLEETIAKLEWCYEHREELAPLGQQAAADMRRLTWTRLAEGLIKASQAN